MTRADVEQAAGNDLGTRQAYLQALDTATVNEKLMVTLLYAQYLASQQDTAAVSTLLNTLQLNELPDEWLDTIISLLYTIHDLNRAQDAINILQARGSIQHGATLHYAMNLAAMQGDFEQAAHLGQELLKRQPDDPTVLLTLADLHQRTGKHNSSQQLLKRLRPEALKAKYLTKAARISERLHQYDQAVAFAYQAFRKARTADSDPYIQFLNLMLRRRDPPVPKTVGEEHAAKLTNSTNPEGWWVIITRDVEPDLKQGEYAPSTALSQALIGKHVGDTVHIGEVIWQIAEIVSKYVYAAKYIFGHVDQLFPDGQRMTRYTVQPLQVLPDGLWAQLKERQVRSARLSKEISLARIPVTVLNAGQFDTETGFWEAVTDAPLEMITDPRDPTFLQKAEEITKSSDVLLHISSLVTLGRARLLRPLLKTHRILITRQTLDDLKHAVHLATQDLERLPLKSLHYHADRVVFYEEPEAVTRQRKHFLQGLETLVRRHARIVPVLGMAQSLEEDSGIYAASISVVHAATERRVPIICDDLKFMLWSVTLPVHSEVNFTTGAVFSYVMTSSGKWSSERGQQARMSFLRLGQTILPLSSSDLKYILEVEETSFGPLTARAVRNLSHPYHATNYAARRLTEFIRLVSIRAVIRLTRERWIRAALDVAALDHDATQLASTIIGNLPDAFHLIPQFISEVRNIIENWLQHRLTAPLVTPPTP